MKLIQDHSLHSGTPHVTGLETIDILPNLPPNIQKYIHRLRLDYLSPTKLINDIEPPACSHCQKTTSRPLLHYILECPITGKLRRNVNNFPNLTNPASRTTAAVLLAKISSPALQS